MKHKRQIKLTWLMYSILLTALVSTVTLSKFITVSTADDTASVASMGVSTEFSFNTKNTALKPGTAITYDFIVTNEKDDVVSEVSQEYTMEFKTTGNLPLQFSLAGKSAEHEVGTLAEFVDGFSENTLNVTTKKGNMPHSAKAKHTYTLTVAWPDNSSDHAYSSEIDAITMIIHTKQVD